MKIMYSTVLAFFVLFSMFDSLYASENEWKLYRDEDDIQLYRRSVKSSNFDEFKGVTVVNARIEVIGMVLRDLPAYSKWMAGCKKLVVIEKFDENNMITYYVQKTIWPVTDRDVVLETVTKIDWESGRFAVELISIEDSRVPPKENLVRMAKMIGKWLVEYIDREHTRVTFIFTSDPAGSLPASLVNDNMKNFPYHTLRGMKRIVKEKKYIEAADRSQEKEILEKYIAEGRFKK